MNSQPEALRETHRCEVFQGWAIPPCFYVSDAFQANVQANVQQEIWVTCQIQAVGEAKSLAPLWSLPNPLCCGILESGRQGGTQTHRGVEEQT